MVQPSGNAAGSAADEDLAENVFLPADRHTLQKLADSRKLLAEGRYGEAVRLLGAILEGPEDFFFQPDKSAPIHRSLKAEAQRLLGQMPREGRELYELQYGARARRMLAEALEQGDIASVAEVSRRFFHTRSGYRATFLLGLDHFDHGRPLAGALTLERLREAGENAEEMEPGLSLTMATCWLQAGVAEKARQSLVSLRQRHPALRVAVAGREVPIFTDDAAAVDWLVGLIGTVTAASPAEVDHWLMFRGDAARNAAAAGGTPLLNVRWRVAVTDDPLTEAALEQHQRRCVEEGTPTIPALHPLAVADVLLMRTARNLLAVDFSTGKRLWEVPDEDAVEFAPGVPAADLQMRQSMLMAGVGQRMWGDMTYGTLSSDGRLVFAIEDLDLGFGPAGNMLFRLGRVAGRIQGIVPGINERADVALQPVGGLRHSQRETEMEPWRPGRAVRARPGRDVLPWPPPAADGPTLRAGRDQRRDPAHGARRRHGQPALVAATGGSRAKHCPGPAAPLGGRVALRTPTGSWFAPPRPARLWASSWPRARCCGDIATATIGTVIGRTSA